VFERFTEGARQVVVLAQDEARSLRHNYIGTEHLLLGLLRDEGGVAARVLESFDMTLEEVRAQVARIVGVGDDELRAGQIPFTVGAKRTLERALREALNLAHNYIGTEHILLGLPRDEEEVAARVLLDFDADEQRIRDAVLAAVGATPRSASARTIEHRALDVPSLRLVVQQAVDALIERHQFEAATRLRDKQRRFQRSLSELTAEVRSIDPPLEPPPSARGAAASRWQYDVKTLEGGTDTWAQQLAAWRRDGWELLSIVGEGERTRAVLERRV